MGIIQVPTSLTIDFDAAMRGPKGDKGDDGTMPFYFDMAQYTPYIGSVGPYSGQQYSSQWGTYAYMRKPEGGGWCWGQASVQFSALGAFDGQLWVSLPIKVANMPGVMGGQCTYDSNPTPQGAWPTLPVASPSWGWPLMRMTGNVTHALLDTNPVPGYNPPPLTMAFLNFHSQLAFNFHYPID